VARFITISKTTVIEVYIEKKTSTHSQVNTELHVFHAFIDKLWARVILNV